MRRVPWVVVLLVGAVLAGAGPAAMPASAVALAQPTGVVAPHVVPRSEWGAAEPRCGSPTAERLLNAVVHHTSGPTQFPDQAAVMARLREIQDEHQNGRGFCDIGYNFLVDAWGTIYEGTAGSIDRAVHGSHVRGLNTGSVSVALVGDFTTDVPSEAMIEAAGRILGWRLGQHGVDPEATITRRVYDGNARWAAGTEVTLAAITGHEEVGVTECPGAEVAARLPQLRAVASAMVEDMRASGQFGEGDAGTPPLGQGLSPLAVVGIVLGAVALVVLVVLGAIVVKVARRVRRERRY